MLLSVTIEDVETKDNPVNSSFCSLRQTLTRIIEYNCYVSPLSDVGNRND